MPAMNVLCWACSFRLVAAARSVADFFSFFFNFLFFAEREKTLLNLCGCLLETKRVL